MADLWITMPPLHIGASPQSPRNTTRTDVLLEAKGCEPHLFWPEALCSVKISGPKALILALKLPVGFERFWSLGDGPPRILASQL